MIRVLATESVYPHLQRCHIIWAVQRLAEITKRSGTYIPLTAGIVLKGGHGSAATFTTIGQLTLSQQVAPALESEASTIPDFNVSAADIVQLDSDDAPPNQLNTSNVDVHQDTNPSAYNTTSSDLHTLNLTFTSPPPPPTLSTQANPPQWGLAYLHNAQPFQSLNVFITVIRAMARIAVFPLREFVQQWSWTDEENRIMVKVIRNPAFPPNARFGDVSWALDFIVKTMLAENRYAEMGGVLFDMVEGEREEYATLEVKKVAGPSMGTVNVA